MKNIVRYFIQGLLITVPVGISFFIVFYIFMKIGQALSFIGLSINPYVDPLIGAVAVFIFIILIGMLGSTILIQPLLLVMDRIAEKTPLFKTVYSSVKDLMSAFVGDKKKFNQPVIVLIDKLNNIQQLGFITQTNLHELGVTDGKVAVYLPNSYAFSGTLVIVPKENIFPLHASSAETLKFIVSGGITHID